MSGYVTEDWLNREDQFGCIQGGETPHVPQLIFTDVERGQSKTSKKQVFHAERRKTIRFFALDVEKNTCIGISSQNLEFGRLSGKECSWERFSD